MNAKKFFCIFLALFLSGCTSPQCEAAIATAYMKGVELNFSATAKARLMTAIPQPTATPLPEPTVAPPIHTPLPDTLSTEQGPDSDIETKTQGKWEEAFYKGATEQMYGWFASLKDPEPESWPRFPNVDNPKVGFAAADGLEYGLDESVFMEQNEFGQMPVQARGYRLITGDYDIPGIDVCEAATVDGGCAIAIFNVGEVTADLKARVRQGFTVPGRYWNGDTLQVAMWALASHASANMLNMATNGAGNDTLNQPDRTNAGANCSVPGGCQKVRFVIAVTSGNQLLVRAVTTVIAE